MKTIAVVISAYNEEQMIGDCLKSVKDFADEIIVVNNSSTDKTEEVARKYTDKVFTRKNNLMLNVNKNFGFSKATSDWILNLDADERVTPELKKEIKEMLAKDITVNGFLIPRKNILFKKWIQNSIWWPDYQLRLFKRGKGKFAEKHVHELLELEGEPAKTEHPIEHYNYQTISQFLHKMDVIYTESEVTNFLEKGKSITWVDAIRFPVNDFLKTFFLQRGYKDGLHGLVLSLLQAFYAEVVFAKIWERQGFKEHNNAHFLQDVYKECMRVSSEFKYWFLTSFIHQSSQPIKKFIYRLARKRVESKLK